MDTVHFDITNFNIFDSRKLKSTQHVRMERMVVAYEFEFYTEGNAGGHWLDGVFYPVRKGACFLAKPGQRIKTVFPYKCAFLDITTEDRSLTDMLDNLPSYFMPMDIGKMVDYLRRMVALESPHELEVKMQLQSYACRIIARLAQYRQSAIFSERGTILHQQTLLMIDRYMREHIDEDLSLEVLAKKCSLDTTYFHKLYTAAFGITPARRVLAYRINAAKQGLLRDEVSLEKLAARCGFSSQAYFCYRFKKYTGMTPLQFRDEKLSKVLPREER